MHISNYIFKKILENSDLSYTVLTPFPSLHQANFLLIGSPSRTEGLDRCNGHFFRCCLLLFIAHKMSFSIKALRDNRPVLEAIKSVVATVSCEAISCWFPCVFLFVCLVFSCRLVFCIFPFGLTCQARRNSWQGL